MEESVDFANWLNNQRIKDSSYMNMEELKEMYLKCIEKEYHKPYYI